MSLIYVISFNYNYIVFIFLTFYIVDTHYICYTFILYIYINLLYIYCLKTDYIFYILLCSLYVYAVYIFYTVNIFYSFIPSFIHSFTLL